MGNFEEAERLTRVVMERYERAISGAEGLEEVTRQFDGLDINTGVFQRFGKSAVYEISQPIRNCHVLEAIARKMLNSWEWLVSETIDGQCHIILIRKSRA